MSRRRSSPESPVDRQNGFTVIELVIALAIAGILMSVVGMSLRPSAERTAANAVQSFIQQSRFDSIKSNRPVVVSYDANKRELKAARAPTSTSTACANASEAGRTLPLTEYRGVGSPDADFALLWLPTGQPRACPAGTAPLDLAEGATFRVQGLSSTLHVMVSSGGEVTLQ